MLAVGSELSRKKMRPCGIIDSQGDISWIIHVATDKPLFQLFRRGCIVGWGASGRWYKGMERWAGEGTGRREEAAGTRNTDNVTVNRHLTRVDREDETVAR